MSLPTNPADKDAADAKSKSEKELRKERFQKAFKAHKEKGCTDEDAMAKALDDADGDEDAAKADDVAKALSDVAALVQDGSNNQALLSKSQQDEMVKSLDGTALKQFETLKAELGQVRVAMRGYIDISKAIQGSFVDALTAVKAENDELRKALTTFGEKLDGAQMAKGLKTDEVPEHLSKPTAVTTAQAAVGTIVPTQADQAAAAIGNKITAGDFIEKGNAFAEKNPDHAQIKELGLAIMDLCNPNSSEVFAKHIANFGQLIGLQG